MIKRMFSLVISLIFICYIPLAFADLYESQDKLKTLAKDFVAKNTALGPDESLEVDINNSDIPAQLATCPTNVEAAFPKEANRERITSVQLSCNGSTSWRTFIPVDVKVYAKVVVAKRTITTNETLTEADLDFAQANVNILYGGYFKDPTEITGQVASQMIAPGSVISKKNIRQQQLVHRNQEIDLVARKNAIEVTVKGIAKSDGGLNDSITVYNPSSKRTLEAVVIGTNKAEVIS